jgi:hypothetical protein
MEDKIKANADLVIEQLGPLSGLKFGYNTESVEWVDGFIENQRIRSDIDKNAVNGLVNTLGSFLGECIIRCYGGYWQNIKGEWCIGFDNKNAVYPFNKVRKQFKNGQGDSIKKFFELIPVLFKDYVQKPAQSDVLEFPSLSASMPFHGTPETNQSTPTVLKEQLERYIRQAEDAYSRIYDEWSSSGRAAAYNECKESIADAIRLARQLGLEDKARELEKKRQHYKEVFRSQMNF